MFGGFNSSISFLLAKCSLPVPALVPGRQVHAPDSKLLRLLSAPVPWALPPLRQTWPWGGVGAAAAAASMGWHQQPELSLTLPAASIKPSSLLLLLPRAGRAPSCCPI